MPPPKTLLENRQVISDNTAQALYYIVQSQPSHDIASAMNVDCVEMAAGGTECKFNSDGSASIIIGLGIGPKTERH